MELETVIYLLRSHPKKVSGLHWDLKSSCSPCSPGSPISQFLQVASAKCFTNGGWEGMGWKAGKAIRETVPASLLLTLRDIPL